MQNQTAMVCTRAYTAHFDSKIKKTIIVNKLGNRFGIPAQFKNDAHLDVWDPNHRMMRDGCAGIPNLSPS